MNYKILLENHSAKDNGFTHPHWEAIADSLESEMKANPVENVDDFYDAAYQELSKQWLLSNRENLAGDYELSETQNFLLLCNENNHIRNNLMRQCELSLKLILDEFGGHLDDSGDGKHVLIVFKSVDEYFNYTSYFSGDGAAPASGGMCIHSGYTHIVLPILNNETPVAEITHELTHALLAKYQVPNWINEAVAMRMEDIAVGYDGLGLTKERAQEHFDYWNEENIQEFWSGEVWGRASEGFELSYELSRILWKKMMTDLHATKEEVVEFIKTLNYDDSGNAAFKAIFNYSLGDLVEDFLGEGNWNPDEAYLKKRSQFFDVSKEWFEELLPLAELSEEELRQSPVSVLKPSSSLKEYFDVLGVKTIEDYMNISAEKVYEHVSLAKEANNEIQLKFKVLELNMRYEDALHDVSCLFALLNDGQMTSGYVEPNQNRCVINIETYLASMVSPSFKQFKVTLEDFGGCSVYPGYKLNQEMVDDDKCITFEEMLSLKPEITGAEVHIGKLLVWCESSLESQDDMAGSGAIFAFHASSAIVTDEEGCEWSLERLEKLAKEYWEEG